MDDNEDALYSIKPRMVMVMVVVMVNVEDDDNDDDDDDDDDYLHVPKVESRRRLDNLDDVDVDALDDCFGCLC